MSNGSDVFAKYLLPKLKRARDPASAFVLKSIKAGRTLDAAVLDAIEAYPVADTLNLRTWIEEARGIEKERREEADEDAADELLIFLDNEPDFYKRKLAIAEMLTKRVAKDTYNQLLGARAWMPIVEDAARRYAKEYAIEREWNKIFVPATRDLVAKWLAERWYANAKAGRPKEV